MNSKQSGSRGRQWAMRRFEEIQAGRATMHWPLLALASACLLAVVAISAHAWVRKMRQEEAAIHFDLRSRLSNADALAKSGRLAAPVSDFTQSLPQAISVDAFVHSLQRSAQAFNVVMANVNSEPRKETSQTLPRLDVTIVLRGGYAGIKSTLSEALSRYPNAVFQQLTLKPDSALPGNEEATIQLVLLLRPSGAVASSS